jgi:hypothetical protein
MNKTKKENRNGLAIRPLATRTILDTIFKLQQIPQTTGEMEMEMEIALGARWFCLLFQGRDLKESTAITAI